MVIKDFVFFILNPKKFTTPYEKLTKKIIGFLVSFSFCIIGIIVSLLFQEFISNFIDDKFNKLNRISYQINLINFFKIVIFIPVIEEIGFRLFLKPTKNIYIPISFSIFFLYFFLAVGIRNNIYLISLFFITFFYFFIKSNKYLLLIKSKYSFFFYFSCVSFATLHIDSFQELTISQKIFFPFLILPYFFYSLSFSFLRIKQGIVWAISLHIIINLIAFSVRFLKLLLQKG